jgi:hypothetical protein
LLATKPKSLSKGILKPIKEDQMIKKPKSLLMLGIPFMLLFFYGCDTPTDERVIQNFQKWHSIEKTVNKKVAFVGESVTVIIKIANRSPYDIGEFWIQKETKKVNYQVRGGNKIIWGDLKRRSVKELSYTFVPRSAGILYISPAKLTKVKVLYEEKAVSIPKHLGYSNSLKIKVIPAGLSVKHLPAKINAVVGGRIDAEIAIKNSSPFDVNHFQLVMDQSSDAFVFLKKIPESRRINSGQEIVLPYSIMPILEGNRTINARIRKIKYDQKRDIFSPHWRDALSAELKIEAKPLKLQASYNFDKTKMKLMEQCFATLHIQNLSNSRIDGIKYEILENGNRLKQLHASSNSNTLSLPPGETRMIKYRYRAIQAGTVNPKKVVIKEIKVNGCWFAFDNRFLKSNAINPIKVSEVGLPGYDRPVKKICPELEAYFDNFLVKTLGIVLGILMAGFLFRLVISTVVADFLYGKIAITSLAGSILAVFSVFLFTGIYWSWQSSITPAFEMCASLWAGSSFCAFLFGVFRMFPKLNFIPGTLISGTLLALMSYALFTGYKAYEHHMFTNYPVELTIFLVFTFAMGLNARLLSKL